MKRATYSADHGVAPSALANHVTRAVARLAVVASAILHVKPIARAGAVAERLLGVDGEAIVQAAQSGVEEHGAVLNEAVVDAARGAGQRIEGVEVDGGGDGNDDAAVDC